MGHVVGGPGPEGVGKNGFLHLVKHSIPTTAGLRQNRGGLHEVLQILDAGALISAGIGHRVGDCLHRIVDDGAIGLFRAGVTAEKIRKLIGGN
ncbi:hypothetical protein DSECCO2_520710 [anaerobic digester metagenome]